MSPIVTGCMEAQFESKFRVHWNVSLPRCKPFVALNQSRCLNQARTLDDARDKWQVHAEDGKRESLGDGISERLRAAEKEAEQLREQLAKAKALQADVSHCLSSLTVIHNCWWGIFFLTSTHNQTLQSTPKHVRKWVTDLKIRKIVSIYVKRPTSFNKVSKNGMAYRWDFCWKLS